MSEREPYIPPSETTSSSEKEALWQQKKQEIDQITDGLERGIDEGIKEMVIACHLHGLTTSQSCEGHLDDEHD